mmetsp:Transcript_5678/g.13815  ORF Transcript_5678/g.13815 Transcript_5678/m.13815 type:complete len:284 (-) Transcript_5678:374-1225(-)
MGSGSSTCTSGSGLRSAGLGFSSALRSGCRGGLATEGGDRLGEVALKLLVAAQSTLVLPKQTVEGVLELPASDLAILALDFARLEHLPEAGTHKPQLDDESLLLAKKDALLLVGSLLAIVALLELAVPGTELPPSLEQASALLRTTEIISCKGAELPAVHSRGDLKVLDVHLVVDDVQATLVVVLVPHEALGLGLARVGLGADHLLSAADGLDHLHLARATVLDDLAAVVLHRTAHGQDVLDVTLGFPVITLDHTVKEAKLAAERAAMTLKTTLSAEAEARQH